MIVHHVRNACFIIESKEWYILVDPMLSPKGALPPFAYFRHPFRRNPLVDLPGSASALLEKASFCLVTHSQKWGLEPLTHTDHLDAPGKALLRKHHIPVVCPENDESYMKKNGIEVAAALGYWQTAELSFGRLTAVPASHGKGWIHSLMANGAGFFLSLPDEPSIYLCGDTLYTPDVHKALTEMKPDIAVAPGGSASLDLGHPILMPKEEVLTFAENAPGKVMINHLEALNHCPTTRKDLKKSLETKELLEKVWIPEDGESMVFH